MGTAVQTGFKRGHTFAALLVKTAISSIYLLPTYTYAQEITAAAAVRFSIPAQPLNAAINMFIQQTGWQVGYAASIISGKQSRSVSGNMVPLAALQLMLSGSNVTIRITGTNTVSLIDANTATQTAPDGSTVLEEIVVSGAHGGVGLGTASVADTGTSTLYGGQITARAEGNDANGILRNLPNVQYQNDIDDDAGITDQSVIDLKPREVSISGARVYENNFILNGMEINDATGSVDRYGSAEFSDSLTPPNEARIIGLHSQTVFVPADFVSETTVIDSNASAKYGNFQGGVVSYKLEDAARDRWKGSATTDYTTSDWAGYHIGTESGLNTTNVERSEYMKRRMSFSATGPITDNLAILGQYSTQSASTSKDRWYRYVESNTVEEDSKNQFYRGQVLADTDLGTFTLEAVYTDYEQNWENAAWRDMRVNAGKTALSTKIQHDYEFEDFSLGGIAFSNVKLQSKLGYSRSKSVNDSNSNVARFYYQSNRSGGVTNWEAQELSDWCRTDPSVTGNTLCYEGAFGDKVQGQNKWNWSQEMTGDFLLGSFLLGVDYNRIDAYRQRPEDVTYYINDTTRYNAGVASFTCTSTEACGPESYSATKSVYKAFDISAQLNQFNVYAEVDQTWNWLNVRAGARVSYDDYMRNLDISPRIVATVTPWQDFSISAGVNRYYVAPSLAFAIRDQQPRVQNYNRSRIGAIVSDVWTPIGSTGVYTNTAQNLDTPFSDEISLGISGVEHLLGGQWRVRFLDRKSKNQFATETSGNTSVMTNSGHGAYQSASAEYSKELESGGIRGLDYLGFNASVTWSKSEVSSDTYYEDDLEDEYIWYKNTSYSRAGFGVVTGNMDIPLRFQAGLSSAWFESRLLLDMNANYNLGYTGARYTDENITVDGQSHEIYEDYDFDPTLTVDLSAAYKIYENDNSGLSLNVKINNLFDETGNATASTSNPWLIGRTVWVGAKATF